MRVGSQAAIAHELRQPVSAMLPAVALMQSRPDIKTGQAAREVIARQVEQLRRVLDDLLDLALVAESKMTLNKQHMDVRRVWSRSQM